MTVNIVGAMSVEVWSKRGTSLVLDFLGTNLSPSTCIQCVWIGTVLPSQILSSDFSTIVLIAPLVDGKRRIDSDLGQDQ